MRRRGQEKEGCSAEVIRLNDRSWGLGVNKLVGLRVGAGMRGLHN